MDGEAGWWTTCGNIGLPPLARVMGVGRQQQDQTKKPDKATGPDDIHPYLFCELTISLCHPLSILFAKSFEEMNAHYTCKEGHISLHKKGSKGEPGNYRSVSITLLLAKCMNIFLGGCHLTHDGK